MAHKRMDTSPTSVLGLYLHHTGVDGVGCWCTHAFTRNFLTTDVYMGKAKSLDCRHSWIFLKPVFAAAN